MENTLEAAVEAASLAPIARRLGEAAEDAARKASAVRDVIDELPESVLLKFKAAMNGYREALSEHMAALQACGDYGQRLMRAAILIELADAEERRKMN